MQFLKNIIGRASAALAAATERADKAAAMRHLGAQDVSINAEDFKPERRPGETQAEYRHRLAAVTAFEKARKKATTYPSQVLGPYKAGRNKAKRAARGGK